MKEGTREGGRGTERRGKGRRGDERERVCALQNF